MLSKITDTNENTIIETGTNGDQGHRRWPDHEFHLHQWSARPSSPGWKTGNLYTSNRLTKITYPDNKSSFYTYHPTSGYLTSVRNFDNYGLNLSYTAVKPYKTASITEVGTSGVLGSSISLDYGLNYTKVTDGTGRSNTYQFSNTGKTISIRDQEGSAAFYGMTVWRSKTPAN